MTTKGRIGAAALKKMKKGFAYALRTLDRCFTQITGVKLNERLAKSSGKGKGRGAILINLLVKLLFTDKMSYQVYKFRLRC